MGTERGVLEKQRFKAGVITKSEWINVNKPAKHFIE